MSLSFFRIVGLVVFAGMTSGCSLFYPHLYFYHIPLPHLSKDGLGLSSIGDFIRMNSHARMFDNEALLKPRLVDFIAQKTPPNGLSREEAESLGMQCAPAPSTECAFLAEQTYRRDHYPRDDSDYGKTTTRNIEVRFSYLKPEELVVKVRVHGSRSRINE